MIVDLGKGYGLRGNIMRSFVSDTMYDVFIMFAAPMIVASLEEG